MDRINAGIGYRPGNLPHNYTIVNPDTTADKENRFDLLPEAVQLVLSEKAGLELKAHQGKIAILILPLFHRYLKETDTLIEGALSR